MACHGARLDNAKLNMEQLTTPFFRWLGENVWHKSSGQHLQYENPQIQILIQCTKKGKFSNRTGTKTFLEHGFARSTTAAFPMVNVEMVFWFEDLKNDHHVTKMVSSQVRLGYFILIKLTDLEIL